MMTYKIFILITTVLTISACGDISDECIKDNERELCYYDNELSKEEAEDILQVLNSQFPYYKNNVKVLNANEKEWSIVLEINTSVAEERQKEFLQSFADSISKYCNDKKTVEIIGATDVEAVGKTAVKVKSKF